ncbi:MAG: hypothetical protein WCO53_10495 [Deltaproteobacteria bacterium]
MSNDTIKAAYAAYLSGRGYSARLDVVLPGTDIQIEVAAVLPRMRDLKKRLKRGFVPTGILQYLIGVDWLGIEEIITQTGYEEGYVASLMKESVENGWVEMDAKDEVPHFRLLDYRIPARECILAFDGTNDLRDKMTRLEKLAGCYHRGNFIFPYALDRDTTEQIVGMGAGIIRYYRDYGVFHDTVPAETNEIDDLRRFALITEYILYNNVWIMTEETI